ncbi:MAG: glycosyltransferase family 2 protein [Bacteroidetes bacterium]|nr:glycosyltransferase family 2 protein [Bacteroidota bacterium]
MKISVIIVAWNSAGYLERCLENLSNQTFRNFNIIVVDNGSSDGCVDNLVKNHASLDIHIKRLGENEGFAVANNIGAQLAKGEWLALLNADAFPEPEWLENLLRAAEQYPNSFFASRQIQANNPNLLDGEGDIYHISGLAWRRNYGLPLQENKNITEVFSACAAAALYPRKDFLEVGGFDEDYFSYHEDVDLGFRLRLKGLNSYYVPQAVVHHVGSASPGNNSDFSIYYGHRNLVWTYFKNMPTLFFWLFLPLHLTTNISSLIWFTINGHGRAIWKSKVDALLDFKNIIKKRNFIQNGRTAPMKDIYRVLDKNLFPPLINSIKRRLSDKNIR